MVDAELQTFTKLLSDNRLATHILAMQLSKIQAYTSRPLKGFFQTCTPGDEVCILIGDFVKQTMLYNEVLECLEGLVHELQIEHSNMTLAWIKLLDGIARDLQTQAEGSPPSTQTLHLSDFADALQHLGQSIPSDCDSWQLAAQSSAETTRIGGDEAKEQANQSDTKVGSQVVHQALNAELAYRDITATIETALFHDHAVHADSIAKATKTPRSPYRDFPLGGCSAIPESVWEVVFSSPALITMLCRTGNPLVVFQCVQDWIENGEDAVLPKMLARLASQEVSKAATATTAAAAATSDEYDEQLQDAVRSLTLEHASKLSQQQDKSKASFASAASSLSALTPARKIDGLPEVGQGLPSFVHLPRCSSNLMSGPRAEYGAIRTSSGTIIDRVIRDRPRDEGSRIPKPSSSKQPSEVSSQP